MEIINVPSPSASKNELPDARQSLSSAEDAALAMSNGRWQAQLNLIIANREAGARLVSCHRRGPLHIQKSFYPEGNEIAHLVILHPPGGLVSGDSLTITAIVEANSKALITTPGAGRLYGARKNAKPQLQSNQLTIKAGASLEWLPMETLFYSRSFGRSDTKVEIEEGGKFIGWDICSLGLPASNELFTEGELRQTFEIVYKGQVDWIERWKFNAEDKNFLASSAGLNGQSCNGVFVAGPFDDGLEPEVIAELQAICQTTRESQQGVAGVSLVKHWLVVRYLGPSTTHARAVFTKAWFILRPLLLDRAACSPRIWAC
jgi:urease accessory protein